MKKLARIISLLAVLFAADAPLAEAGTVAPSDKAIAEAVREIGLSVDLLNGNCGVLAIALQRRFGGAVLAYSLEPDGDVVGLVMHAAWRSPSGRLIDGRGFITKTILSERRPYRGSWAIREVSSLQGYEEAVIRQTNPSITISEAVAMLGKALGLDE